MDNINLLINSIIVAVIQTAVIETVARSPVRLPASILCQGLSGLENLVLIN